MLLREVGGSLLGSGANDGVLRYQGTPQLTTFSRAMFLRVSDSCFENCLLQNVLGKKVIFAQSCGQENVLAINCL